MCSAVRRKQKSCSISRKASVAHPGILHADMGRGRSTPGTAEVRVPYMLEWDEDEVFGFLFRKEDHINPPPENDNAIWRALNRGALSKGG